jgi:hypothetical protein
LVRADWSARRSGANVEAYQLEPLRLQLVGLHVRAAAERGLVGVVVRGGDRAPAHRVDVGREGVRVVERLWCDGFRQALVRGDGVPNLKLPHDGQLGAELVLLKRLQVHDVGDARLALVGLAAACWSLRDHVGDRPAGPAHVDDLAAVGQRRCRRDGHLQSAPCDNRAAPIGAVPIMH